MMSNGKKARITLIGLVAAGMLLQIPSHTVKASTKAVDRNIYNGELENGRVLVPLRQIGEKLGAEVTWSSSTQTATLTNDGVRLEVQLGSKDMLVDGRTIRMDVATHAENGRTYIPLRFIGEALGYNVNWYKDARIAYLEDKAPFIGVYVQPLIDSEGFALLDLAIRKAENLSKIQQKRAYLKPYFTDAMINSLIKEGGLMQKASFHNAPITFYSYPSNSSMKIYREIIILEDSGYATQESLLVKKGDRWLINSIKYGFYEMRP